MITTQLLPAAGLLPFVFTRICEVKGVGESCRYVWLAVWISAIWYPKVFFFLDNPPNLEKLKEGEKFCKNVPLEKENCTELHDKRENMRGITNDSSMWRLASGILFVLSLLTTLILDQLNFYTMFSLKNFNKFESLLVKMHWERQYIFKTTDKAIFY